MTQPSAPAAPAADKPAAAAPKPKRIAPFPTTNDKFFWDAADKSELVGERCSDCTQWRFPPRPMCPHCGSVKREVVKLSGRGKVYSWVIPRHPPVPFLPEGSIVAVIELEEGFRFVSNVEGIDADRITPGMAVEVAFVPTMNNHQLPVFRPAGAR